MFNEVAQFLAELRRDLSDAVQVRMNRILPQEGIGPLLSMRSEKLHAAVLGQLDG